MPIVDNVEIPEDWFEKHCPRAIWVKDLTQGPNNETKFLTMGFKPAPLTQAQHPNSLYVWEADHFIKPLHLLLNSSHHIQKLFIYFT